MGLDMYLSARLYASDYNYQGGAQKTEVQNILDAVGVSRDLLCKEAPSVNVSVTVAYWRKANAIHDWFVQNVADGVDNCRPMYVDRDRLTELRDTCQDVLDMKDREANNPDEALPTAEDLLPTASGFFFGDTDYDEWYYGYISHTAEQLTKLLEDESLKDFDFEYRASW